MKHKFLQEFFSELHGGASISLQPLEGQWWSTYFHAAGGKAPGWNREKCEEEGLIERSCYRLTVDPIPHPPVPLGGEEVEEVGIKE